jgi:hypothetical protein
MIGEKFIKNDIRNPNTDKRVMPPKVSLIFLSTELPIKNMGIIQ